MAPKHYKFSCIWETVAPTQDQLVNTGVVLDEPGTTPATTVLASLLDQWQTWFRPVVSNTVKLKELHVLSLDTTATSVQASFTGTVAGGLTGLAPTLSACQIVTWTTANRGPKHRGRIYLPMANSNAISDGQDGWSATQVDNVLTAALGFLGDLESDGFPLGKMTDGDFEAFTGAVARDYIGTQRRRVNRRQ